MIYFIFQFVYISSNSIQTCLDIWALEHKSLSFGLLKSLLYCSSDLMLPWQATSKRITLDAHDVDALLYFWSFDTFNLVGLESFLSV